MFNFASELKELEEQDLKRTLRVLRPNGLINFASNDYLGLASDPRLKEAAIKAIERYGTSASSSRLLSGTLDIHSELEFALAKLKGAETALVFSSGYHANIGVITSLVGQGDAVIIDRLCHASIIDACHLSGAKLLVYRHCDLNNLEHVLKRSSQYRKRLLITEGVFSMDGDIAPLPEIAALTKRYGVWLMVDDAHGTGVLGHDGSGTTGLMNVAGKIDIVMGTLSKALGSLGGFIAGSKELIEFLINKARSFIYTTALPPAQAASALKAIQIVKKEPWRREKVLSLAANLRQTLDSLGLKIIDGNSTIVPVLFGDVAITIKYADTLYKSGILAPAIRPPTIPQGSSRIRFSLTANHTTNDINKVARVLGNAAGS